MTTEEGTETRDDPQALLVGLDGPPMANGKILPELDADGQETGFKLFVPSEEEQKRMERRIADELNTTEQEHANLYARMLKNIHAYEALPDADKKDLLTLPLGKKDVNHLVGFYVNRIWNKRPIASVIPEEYGMYEVPIPTEQVDPFTGQRVSAVEMRSAEEISGGGEKLLEHYLRNPKTNFHKFLYDVVMSSVQGAPAWGKTEYRRVTRPQLVPNWRRLPNGQVVADGYKEMERVVGCPHKFVAKSGFDVMVATPWVDVQEAEMAFEHDPHTIIEGRNKVKQNEWYLVSDDDWKELYKACTTLERYEERNTAEELKAGRTIERPRDFLDVFHVSMFWPVVFDDETGQTMEGVFSLVVPFERTTGKILAAPLMPYAHGRRNLVPYVQRPRPFDLGGYSTMEDVAPLQRVQTRLFHSQIENAMLANTVWTKVRPGSTAWTWLKSNEIRARSKVPVQNPQDIESSVLGRELRSLAPEIAAIGAFATGITVSDTVKGATLQGRTSRAAISLVQEAGLTVPNMDLDFLNDRLSENVGMLYHNISQWAMYGEEIPFRNPETRALAMKAVQFPLDGPGQFSVRISASSDEETAQFEFERDLGLAKVQQEFFQTFASLVGPMVNPNAPPVIEAFQKPMLVALNLMQSRICELAKLDPEKYTFTEKKIDEILQAHRQWVMEQMQAQMQAAAQRGPQPPPPPKVSISLSGKLTPDQEAKAAETQGIGGMSAGAGGSVVQGPFGGGVPAGAATTNPA